MRLTELSKPVELADAELSKPVKLAEVKPPTLAGYYRVKSRVHYQRYFVAIVPLVSIEEACL
jgi:hypothetical protein